MNIFLVQNINTGKTDAIEDLETCPKFNFQSGKIKGDFFTKIKFVLLKHKSKFICIR